MAKKRQITTGCLSLWASEHRREGAPNGDPAEPKILIDNKDKSVIAESDIEKVVRDARERSIGIAALVACEESQLRLIDRESRWSRKDGVWVLRTTRQWIARDLDLLKPIFERMRVHGFDLLEKNAVLAEDSRYGALPLTRFFPGSGLGDIGRRQRSPVNLLPAQITVELH